MKEKLLDNDKLTPTEQAIKKRFKFILDSMQSWPDAPILSNPFVKSVTSNSALVGATITNTGSSHLIDRGSNIVMHEKLCIIGTKQNARSNGCHRYFF